MIFRAIFWIGLVAVLMPREPDLGLGRPAALDMPGDSGVAEWGKAYLARGANDPESVCRLNAKACAGAATLLGQFRSATLSRLAEVKADIEASDKRRD